jgi:hypothetical protein
MIIGGFWHGANWTFVVWGAIHGVGLSLERLLRRAAGMQQRPDAEAAPASFAATWAWRIVTFHLVCLAWVFFRAASIGEAMTFLAGLGSWKWIPEYGIALRFLLVFSVPLLIIDLFNESRREEYLFEHSLDMQRVAVGVAAMACVALFAANQLNAFIYFQF